MSLRWGWFWALREVTQPLGMNALTSHLRTHGGLPIAMIIPGTSGCKGQVGLLKPVRRWFWGIICVALRVLRLPFSFPLVEVRFRGSKHVVEARHHRTALVSCLSSKEEETGDMT